MKYFKHSVTNEIYAYEADGSQDEFILSGLIPVTLEEAKQFIAASVSKITKEQIAARKQAAFQKEADPLFFKAQRGEATLDEWKAKVEEIRNRIV